jgi:hypothetical protein
MRHIWRTDTKARIRAIQRRKMTLMPDRLDVHADSGLKLRRCTHRFRPLATAVVQLRKTTPRVATSHRKGFVHDTIRVSSALSDVPCVPYIRPLQHPRLESCNIEPLGGRSGERPSAIIAVLKRRDVYASFESEFGHGELFLRGR